jgi:hypothetical protein
MSIRYSWSAAIVALSLTVTAVPISAQRSPQTQGDPRKAVALSPPEAETLLIGMRTYLETIQGIVAALAENDIARVPAIAAQSGAKMLHSVPPMTGLKAPVGFAMMSFDTHDKFDKLAEKATRGTSRTELLSDLRDIMGNCISCHASYRLAP